MASSSNPSAPPLGRQPSFFGALKNLVAAPLTWLAGADQDDQRGKRRHEQVVQEPERGTEDETPRKRQRVRSPPRNRAIPAYLDPPASAFPNRSKRRSPAPVARSYSTSHSNLNPSRNLKPNVSRTTMSPAPGRLGRTMSIDPPMGLRRETSIHDIVMESDPAPQPQRDHSMPPAPLASRPSFRMRSSLTPQPQREVSEPPPLSHLGSNPVFVRAPPPQESRPIMTLGNIAGGARTDRSPHRHVPSLLGRAGHLDLRNRRAESAPVEKALEELDIYRTPLIPTRLRSAYPSSTAAAIPDMFKPRRTSQLVLMDDDRDRRKTTAPKKSPKASGDKPYAGEGGMKKLLARRKQEEEPSDETQERPAQETSERFQSKAPDPSTFEAAPKPPSASGSREFWHTKAASETATIPASSLRVGRTKTSRNHIARPTMSRHRTKFSAKFEEDGDDAMDGDEEASEREHALLDEAQKKLPAFEMPAGFTFAKPESKPLENDLTNAKEPPMTSLPFSFAKPAALPETGKSEASTSRKENSEFVGFGGFGGETASISKPTRSLADAPPLGAPGEVSEVKRNETNIQPAGTASGSTVPNFFANSAAVTKPLVLPPAPPLSFGATPSLFGPPPKTEAPAGSGVSASKATPVEDQDNPFLAKASGTPSTADTTPTANLFSTTSAPSASSSVPFSFSAPKVDVPSNSKPLPFSFGQSAADKATTETDSKVAEVPKATEGQADTPKPLFGGFSAQTSNANATTEAAKPTLFGATAPKPAEPASTSSSPFTFGAPPASSSSTTVETPKPLFGTTSEAKPLFGSTPAPAPVEAPKPLFGNGTAFSFGTTTAASSTPATAVTPASPAPFTFGATPSTPTSNAPAASPFSFGATTPSTAAPAAPAPFSFNATSSTATEAPKAPFTFGVPAPINPTERPSTPPKNSDQEFRMEESPTREVHANGAAKPPMNFSFGNPPSSSTLFGGPPQINTAVPPTSFSFGTSAPPNPFSSAKPEEAKPFSFTVTPAPTPSVATAPFSFGPSKSTGSEIPRPSTGGGFTFGAGTAPTSAPAGSAPFTFGSTPAPNPFAPTSTASAPGSPSTFNQPSPFSFNAPLPAANAPFAFGSQPASPAGSTSGLPATGFGAPASGFGQTAPSSPFSAPGISLSNSTGSPATGNTLFTIGAAPTNPPPSAAGARVTKRLPTRRAGAKR